MTDIKWYSADDLLTIACEAWSGVEWEQEAFIHDGVRHIVAQTEDLHMAIWQCGLGEVHIWIDTDPDGASVPLAHWHGHTAKLAGMIVYAREQAIARLERILAVCKGGAK